MENGNVKFTAMVMAAGTGSRMHSDEKKQFMALLGEPTILYSLRAFQNDPRISSIVVVTGKEDIDRVLKICFSNGIRKISNIVEGGSQRFRSVANGLRVVPGDTDYVLIHDAARPLIDGALIGRICENAVLYRACVAAVPVKDTIKQADENGFTIRTIDRAGLWSVQTPQAFSFDLIRKAYDKLFATIEAYHPDESKITDDAVIVENMSDCRVRMVMGDYKNLKITTPEDLVLAEAFLKEKMRGENAEEA